MGTQVIISTRRLRLRTWRRGDWKIFNSTLNTDPVMEWLGSRVSAQLVQREVDWNMRHFHRHGFCFFAMERKSDRAFVGFCGVIRIGEIASPIRGELEIGWRVREAMWRRGYALEAARAILDWAEQHLPGQTIYSRINPENIASVSLARKLGMKKLTGGRHTHPTDGMLLDLYWVHPGGS